jgi:hypothetical protein
MAYGDLDNNLEVLYRMIGIVAQENILGLLRDDDSAFYQKVASTGRLIACSEVDWTEFPGNKVYFEGVPPELPNDIVSITASKYQELRGRLTAL